MPLIRRRVQFHLSTCVFISLLAGGALWLQLSPVLVDHGDKFYFEVKGIPLDYESWSYGWPLGVVRSDRENGEWTLNIESHPVIRVSIDFLSSIVPLLICVTIFERHARRRKVVQTCNPI